jgi:hypothetical protein
MLANDYHLTAEGLRSMDWLRNDLAEPQAFRRTGTSRALPYFPCAFPSIELNPVAVVLFGCAVVAKEWQPMQLLFCVCMKVSSTGLMRVLVLMSPGLPGETGTVSGTGVFKFSTVFDHCVSIIA